MLAATPPEREDVRGRPRSKEQCEHLARYEWAAGLVSGEVLDVACGTGYGTALLSGSAATTGIDSSDEALRVARERYGDRFIRAIVPPLPRDDRSVDWIVCFETIEHVGEDDALVREFARVLRVGGGLLISTPNAAATPGANPWHVREYTDKELWALLERNGLRVKALYGQSTPPASPRGHRYLWRAHAALWGMPVIRERLARVIGDTTPRPDTPSRVVPAYWIAHAQLSAPGGARS